MVHHWPLLFILVLAGPVLGQDERYYRQILSGELPQMSVPVKEDPMHQLNVFGASYVIDLNGDGIDETISPQKRDGVDWLEIKDSSKRTVFEGKLFSMGAESVLYKVKLVSLSSTARALILFLDEGHTKGKQFESTARIFVISFENGDLSTMKLASGPHFYHEKESIREQYFRRAHLVNLIDINEDGKKEIIVHFNQIQRIMEYLGNGEWRRY